MDSKVTQPYMFLLIIFKLVCFFFLLLRWMSSFYIVHTNPLSAMWFANILSHSVACFFILLIISLLCRSVSVNAILSTFAFLAVAFRVRSKNKQKQKHCQDWCQGTNDMNVWMNGPVSFFHVWLSSFSNTNYYRDGLSSLHILDSSVMN